MYYLCVWWVYEQNWCFCDVCYVCGYVVDELVCDVVLFMGVYYDYVCVLFDGMVYDQMSDVGVGLICLNEL